MPTVMELTEGMVRRLWKEVLDIDVPKVQHMEYAEAMLKYGSDKPDLRYGMEIVELSGLYPDFRLYRLPTRRGKWRRLPRL